MTSKCGKNKKVAHEAIAECVTDVLTTFWRPLWSIYWTDARQHGIYMFYTIKKQTTTAFLFQNSKADVCPLRRTRKKPFDAICCQNENEAISLVAIRSKRIVIGPGKSRHLQLDLNGFPWNENLGLIHTSDGIGSARSVTIQCKSKIGIGSRVGSSTESEWEGSEEFLFLPIPLPLTTPLPLLVWTSPYSESRIELRNPQILKKMLEKSR